jgi:hypothetical protein
MPNIVICGFARDHAEFLRGKFNGIAEELKLCDDAVTSIVPMDVKGCNGSLSSRPYVIIRATTRTEIDQIIGAMKERGLAVEVEIELIDGFISAEDMRR